MACIIIPRNIAIVASEAMKYRLKLHRLVKWPIFTSGKGNYENTKKEIAAHISTGRSVFLYVSKPPVLYPYPGKIRLGTFRIAKELGVPVTAMAIDVISSAYGAIPYQKFQLKVGETFYVDDVGTGVARVRKFFKDTLDDFKKQKRT
jgi:hypothetical protein